MTVSLEALIANSAHMVNKQLTKCHMFPLKVIKVIDEFVVRNEPNCIPTHLWGVVKNLIISAIVFNSIFDKRPFSIFLHSIAIDFL